MMIYGTWYNDSMNGVIYSSSFNFIFKYAQEVEKCVLN